MNILTTREIEVANLFAKGKTVKEIAKLLSISPGTVAKHREKLHAKLRITKTSQMISIWQEKPTPQRTSQHN